MTPKEKAQELYNKFYSAIPTVDDDGQHQHASAKQCAIIAVDEILNLSKIASLRRDEVYMELEYWMEVKQEIEKL